MADVFVSYSRRNYDRVAQISGGLENGGYSLWWDERLNASDDYAMLIEAEIDAAACVVVAWSQTARQSLWVRAEANEALDAGKLVQVNLDRSRLPLPFTMLHFLDFSRWQGAWRGSPWSDLETRVSAMLSGEPAAAVERDTPPGPALQGFGRVALLGWAAIAVAALMAAAIVLAARGSLSPAAFGGLTLIGLATAAILLALAAFTLVRISMSSRR